MATFSFADEGDGASAADASRADSEVGMEEGRLPGKGSTFNKLAAGRVGIPWYSYHAITYQTTRR